MIGKLKALATGPFAIAILIVALLSGGIAAGIVMQKRSDEAKLRQIAEQRRAAAIAAAGPPKPTLQVQPPSGPSPVAHRYIPLGEEFVSNLGRSVRFIMIEVSVGTRYGPQAEAILTTHKTALRAELLASLSELTYAVASKPDAQPMIAGRIADVLNAFIIEREKIKLIDEVLITSFVVK